MIIELNKNSSKTEIRKALEKIRRSIYKKKKSPFKYFGKLKLDVDPLEFQKDIRNEWD